MPLPVLKILPPLPKIKKKIKPARPPPHEPSRTPPPLPVSPPSSQRQRFIAPVGSSIPSKPRTEIQQYGNRYRVRCQPHPLPLKPKPAPIPSAAVAATATARGGDEGGGGGSASERREEGRSALEKEVSLRTASRSPSREDWNGINPFSKNPTSFLPTTTLKSLSTSSSSSTTTPQQPQHRRQSSAWSDSSFLTEESQQLSTPSLRDEAPLPPVTIAGLGSPILLDNVQLPKPFEGTKDGNQQQPVAGPSLHVERSRPSLPSLSTVELQTSSAPLNVQLSTSTSAKPTQQVEESDEEQFEHDEELLDDSPCSSRQRQVSSLPSSRSTSPSPSTASVGEDDLTEEMQCRVGSEAGRKRCRDEYEAMDEEEEETAEDNERLQALYANSSSDVRRKRQETFRLREALARAEEEQEEAESKNNDVKALMITHYGFSPADEEEGESNVDVDPTCGAKMEEA